MAPPSVPLRHYADASVTTTRQVTLDTPPDLLQGSMNLKVTLPSGKQTNLNVHRSTPMMDVLVQVTSAHKINPGNHAIRVICNSRNVPYKPSTAVGSLDTSAIEIVSKTSIQEGSNKDDKQSKDKKVRLKVNLPRNQLAVYRLPPKTLIAEVLTLICEDKNLDEEIFEIRHPVNVDERLRDSCSLSDYQLQEVCVVPKNYRPPPLSVNDLFAMSSLSHHHEDRKRRGFRAFFSRKNKHNIGNSSLSSGSTGDRSDSPENESTKMQSSRISLNETDGIRCRPNDPKIFRPTSLLNLNRVPRKRPAPRPPPQGSAFNGTFANGKSAATSCHNLSVDSGRQTLTPASCELEEDRKASSRNSSRNMNSPVGGPIVPSRIKRKAPLPPQVTANSADAVSSHDKDVSVSPSPDIPMFVESETRSTTPSEVSIDVRPSSSEASDAILEDDVKQDSPLALIAPRSSSAASTGSSVGKDIIHYEAEIKELKDDGSRIQEIVVAEDPKIATPPRQTEDREEIIESTLKSDSIDEENSAEKPLETLDAILNKAEEDLNGISGCSSPDDLTYHENLTAISQNKETNVNSSKEETTENFANEDDASISEVASEFSAKLDIHDISINGDTSELSANADIYHPKSATETQIHEALNEMWNAEDKDLSPSVKETHQNKVQFRESEVEIHKPECSESQILVFNFVDKTSDRYKNNSTNHNGRQESKPRYSAELESSLTSSEVGDSSLGTVSASNYNVILKMKPQPKPRSEMGRKSPSTESTSSYYSFRTDSESKSRSNTDASYESVPPPLPSQPIPELSEFDDDRSIYSIVSSASSNDVAHGQREVPSEVVPKTSNDLKSRMFSISTYTNRDQKRSYTKRITRSESLQEISRPLEIDRIEARTSSLQRNRSVKNDISKSNFSSEGSNSLERSYRYRIGSKETFEKTPKILEESANNGNQRAEETVKRVIKPVVPLRVSKWYQEFHKEYIGPRKPSNLRKTKSTADIRMNDGQPPQAGAPDPGLAQEYVKLQNDFMKWQNQLMQNQNLLHDKVAPIAAPNMMMGPNTQTSYNAEPEPPKRREINIPIRMEGENETFVNQTSSFTTTDTMRSTGNNESVNNLGNQSQGMWNTPANVTMGAWGDRPSNVECVIVSDPPQIFQAPDDPRFQPVFIRREMNPSGFPAGFLPPEPVFAEPQFERPSFGVNNQFNNFGSRPQFPEGNNQYVAPPQYNEGAPLNNSFQPPPSREVDSNNQNDGNYMPRFSSSQKVPSFNHEPMDRDNTNGKFKSVVTLSNDEKSNASPQRGKSAQFNVTSTPNKESSEANTFTPMKKTLAGNNFNSGENNRPNAWKKSHSPEKPQLNFMAKDSVTPMSSRLVQAASTQPCAYDSRSTPPSNFDNDSSSQYTPYKPAPVPQYASGNSMIEPPASVYDSRPVDESPAAYESRVSPKPSMFDSRVSPKPTTFDPMPAPTAQVFPPMPKFEPPPSFQTEPEPIRVSPPRRQKKSPSPIKQDVSPRNFQTPNSRPSPIRDQLSDSFSGMKLPPASPDHFQAPSSAVPPPPAPPGDNVPPPPPPPPPRMQPEIRRTSTGKKIFSSNQAPELDAREELMMAIRKFGGSGSLRKTGDAVDY